MSLEDAEKYVKKMEQQKRYSADVWSQNNESKRQRRIKVYFFYNFDGKKYKKYFDEIFSWIYMCRA